MSENILEIELRPGEEISVETGEELSNGKGEEHEYQRIGELYPYTPNSNNPRNTGIKRLQSITWREIFPLRPAERFCQSLPVRLHPTMELEATEGWDFM